MNNLTHGLGALSIKELERRQEELREELRQIQEQITFAQQIESAIREVVTAVEKCHNRIEKFAPGSSEKLWEAILDCKDELSSTLLGQWNAAKDNPANRSSESGKVAESTPVVTKETGAKKVSISGENDDSEAFKKYVGTPAVSFIPTVNLDKVVAEIDEGVPTPVAASQSYAEFVNLTPKVGYMRRVDDGQILGAYLGGKNKSLLEVWAKCVAETSLAHGMKCVHEVRTAQRLKNSKYEVKFKNISFSVLEALTRIDTAKSPKWQGTDILPLPSASEESTVAVGEEKPAPVDESDECASVLLQVGDRVLIKSDRHGDEFVDKVGIVSAPTKIGAAINVAGTLKYFHVDEVGVTERSPEVRNPANDLTVSASASLDLTDDAVPW